MSMIGERSSERGLRVRATRRLLLLTACGIMHGCVATPDADTGPFPETSATVAESTTADPFPVLGRRTERPYRLVAIDLVNALVQTEAFRNGSVTVRLPLATTPFATALESELVDRAVDVERVDTRTGRGVLMSSVLPDRDTDAGNRYTFVIALDRLAMKRTYRLDDRFVVPVSSLYVRGAEPATIALDDGLFLDGEGTRTGDAPSASQPAPRI